MFELKTLKRKLVNIHISGISTIARALASTKDDKNKDEYVIFAEGMGFGEVLKIPGIDVKKSYSNHIIEVEQSLGIEAARQSIINQVTETMKGHGVNVNQRHVDMLA